jgi:hypothetical protein
MQDMAAGTYRLPWKVDVTDGSAFGFAAPTRTYQGAEENPVIPDAAPAAPITKAA